MEGTKITPIHHDLKFNLGFIGILLPVGYFLHRGVREASVGDMVSTYDSHTGVLMAKAEVGADTAIADALSWEIYGIPVKKLMALLRKNWGDELDPDVLLYIVVKDANIQNSSKIR